MSSASSHLFPLSAPARARQINHGRVCEPPRLKLASELRDPRLLSCLGRLAKSLG
jgi:hypothetical protein